MSTQNIPFPTMKKKIILKDPKSAAMGFVLTLKEITSQTD